MAPRLLSYFVSFRTAARMFLIFPLCAAARDATADIYGTHFPDKTEYSMIII